MRLRWVRGRDSFLTETVVHLAGPLATDHGVFHAVALDDEARLIRLLPLPPAEGDWLALVGGRVVGRAAAPLAAVRRAEAALQ